MNEPTNVDELAAARKAERVMGFDFGLRRIGVAIGVRITGTANPLLVLENTDKGPNWNRLDALIREWKPHAIVVGDPVDMSGSPQVMTNLARRFAQDLRERYQVPVANQDERLSSREAERQFVAGRQAGNKRRKDAALLDAVAAQLILQNWFNHEN